MKAGRFTAALTVMMFTVVLSACGDPFAPDEVVEPGSLSLSYSGEAASGTFSVQGAPTLISSTGAEFGAWAVGGTARKFPKEKLLAVAFRGNSERDGILVAVSFPRTEVPATFPISANCELGCSGAVLLSGIDPRRFEGTDRSCWLIWGTLHLAVLNDDRAAGTFSGKGKCITISNGTISNIVVEDGSFDVDIVEKYRPETDI